MKKPKFYKIRINLVTLVVGLQRHLHYSWRACSFPIIICCGLRVAVCRGFQLRLRPADSDWACGGTELEADHWLRGKYRVTTTSAHQIEESMTKRDKKRENRIAIFFWRYWDQSTMINIWPGINFFVLLTFCC